MTDQPDTQNIDELPVNPSLNRKDIASALYAVIYQKQFDQVRVGSFEDNKFKPLLTKVMVVTRFCVASFGEGKADWNEGTLMVGFIEYMNISNVVKVLDYMIMDYSRSRTRTKGYLKVGIRNVETIIAAKQILINSVKPSANSNKPEQVNEPSES